MRAREVDLRELTVDKSIQHRVLWYVSRRVGQLNVKVEADTILVHHAANIDKADGWWFAHTALWAHTAEIVVKNVSVLKLEADSLANAGCQRWRRRRRSAWWHWR